jgi:transketolase
MSKDENRIDKGRCRNFRRRILEVSQKLPALHIAPAFSCLELVDAIYFKLMRRDGPNPDTFILSKGHGAMAQFVVLEALGVLSKGDLDNACRSGGRVGGHPDYGLPGVEASTGSLGHGLPIALGMAAADRERKLDRTIYLVMSDGELQEGSCWEAFLLAPTLRLTNIVVFVDYNDFISRGRLSQNHPNFHPPAEKIRAFGWETVETDGHDHEAIVRAVRNRSKEKPLAVVARTTKGKGVSYMENQAIWAFRSPNAEEYKIAMTELKEDEQ